MYLVQFINYLDQPINEAAFISEHDAQAWVKMQKEVYYNFNYRVAKAEQYLHNMTPAKED